MLQVITICSIALLIALDQLIKLLVLKYLAPIGSFPLIGGFVQLNYAENTGAAFGFFSGFTGILSAITFCVIAVGIYLLLTKKVKFGVPYVCAVVIIAGGAGNLIDRIFRGFVIDYIEPLFIDFAIFNFADILVTCGAAVLIFWILFDTFREKKAEAVKNE